MNKATEPPQSGTDGRGCTFPCAHGGTKGPAWARTHTAPPLTVAAAVAPGFPYLPLSSGCTHLPERTRHRLYRKALPLPPPGEVMLETLALQTGQDRLRVQLHFGVQLWVCLCTRLRAQSLARPAAGRIRAAPSPWFSDSGGQTVTHGLHN